MEKKIYCVGAKATIPTGKTKTSKNYVFSTKEDAIGQAMANVLNEMMEDAEYTVDYKNSVILGHHRDLDIKIEFSIMNEM